MPLFRCFIRGGNFPGKMIGKKDQDAKVCFEKIDEVPADTERKPNKGFTFFTMGT